MVKKYNLQVKFNIFSKQVPVLVLTLLDLMSA